MTKEIISKVNEELKAQGINATEAQIESAVKKVMSKQELNKDAMENVAGGFNPVALLPYLPTIIKTAKELIGGGDKNEDNKDGGSQITKTQTNQNEKSNQLVNVEGSNTQTTNTFNFN